MRLSLTCLSLTLATAAASAQPAASAAAHIKLGDREYAARHAQAALAQYEAAIAASPKSVEALWKASRTAAELGQFSDSTRDAMYATSERDARRAVVLDSSNANAQFALAQVLGLEALTHADPQARLPYAQETYHHATTCLKLAPTSIPCAHVLGAWNAEVMRTDAGLRETAIVMLGAKELSNASWDNAIRYLVQAIHAEPNRAVHHFDLAQAYWSMEETAKAKGEFEAVLRAPVTDFNDPHYKQEATDALAHF